jgi:hypothetical protein
MSESQPKPSRRGFMLGAAVAGAATAAVVTLPQIASSPWPPRPRPGCRPPENGGGLPRVSEHVKRYYKSTLV